MTKEEIEAQKVKDEQEKAALLSDIESKVQKMLDDSKKESITEKQLNKKVDEINKQIADNLDNEGMKKLNDSVAKMIEAQAKAEKSIEEIGLAVKVVRFPWPY